MAKFLGEKRVVLMNHTPFKGYDRIAWALWFIGTYGQIDGAHHKLWVLDQAARILMGTSLVVKQAKWDDGQSEYRVSTGKPSKQYLKWVDALRDGEDGPETYGYDEGLAP